MIGVFNHKYTNMEQLFSEFQPFSFGFSIIIYDNFPTLKPDAIDHATYTREQYLVNSHKNQEFNTKVRLFWAGYKQNLLLFSQKLHALNNDC